MKTIVTGGAGFIGSHVVDALLTAGHDVLVLDNMFSGRASNLENAKKIALELSRELRVQDFDVSKKEDWQSLKGCGAQALFHIAAQTSVTVSVDDPDRDFSWNVLSVKHIADFLREEKMNYFLYANTAGAMYGNVDSFPTPENAEIKAAAPYGATKAFTELYINALCQSLKASKHWSNHSGDENYFSWASMRLANVFGERQITKGEAGVVPIFSEKLSSKIQPTIFGSGNETRDYVYVGDVVSAFMTAFNFMQSEAVDSGFNVASGIETTTKEVFQGVYESLKKLHYSEETLPSSPAESALRPGEIERSCLSIDKAQKLLNWTPQENFQSKIFDVVRYYVENEIN